MTLPSTTSRRCRLDEMLVQRGLFASRARARDAIVRGTVTVDGQPVMKPGFSAGETAEIAVNDPAQHYVSRAALKLVAGLDRFGFDPADREALDIGASTGGFTQVLLERGVRHVTALDVGHGQLDPTLSGDPRVTSLEKLNARDLMRDHLDGARPDFIVSDVSFISLKLALPPALDLAEQGAACVLLVKPQFEAGRQAIGKGGILRDPADADRIADDLCGWLDKQPGWRVVGVTPSPIEGSDGNREFLLGGMKDR